MVVKILLHNFGAEIRKKPMNIKLISLLNLLKSINHSRFIAIALYFTLFIILLDIFYVIYNILYQVSTLDEFICNMTSNSNTGSDNNFTANCPLEGGEMNNPFLDILDSLFLFNVLELVIILIIIYFILSVLLKNRIGIFIAKYLPNRFNGIINYLSKNNVKINFTFILVYIFTSAIYVYMVELVIIWLYFRLVGIIRYSLRS